MPQPLHRRARGFTLIELMVVIAIIGIMATMAMPSYQDRVIRAQVSEGLALADFAKQAVAAHHTKTKRLPASNEAAGLPPANRIVGNYVSSVAVADGVVTITFGNQSNRNLVGKKLSLRPATVADYPQVPIAWVCGTAGVPEKMAVSGHNATDLPGPHLPLDCRSFSGRSE
jgi:type IV pilus assembly protein PilA